MPSDVHVRNLALAVPGLEELSEEAFMSRLGPPDVGTVSRANGQHIPPGVPQYLVRPSSFPVDLKQSTPHVKLVDFGEAFLRAEPPRLLHTPLVVRPPEAVFEDRLDLEVDVWSMGCMVSSLFMQRPG